MQLICFAVLCAALIQSAASVRCPTGANATHTLGCHDCGSLNYCFKLTNIANTISYYGCDDSSQTKCKQMREDKFGGNGACYTSNTGLCGSGSESGSNHNAATGLAIIIPLVVLFLRL